MNGPKLLTDKDSILDALEFRPYRNMVERRAVQYLPEADEPQSVDIETPWGGVLTASYGDYIVNELESPDDRWPVKQDIFESTYMQTRPGYYVKRALTDLIPLTAVTGGDEDGLVTVKTLEGTETVRAGDFYLARGVKGEIWPLPKNKVDSTMVCVITD